MKKSASRCALFVFMLIVLFPFAPVMAQTPDPTGVVIISSPSDGGVLGGLVSVLGTVNLEPLGGYTVAFGPGENPVQWILVVGPRQARVIDGRLAFWDTTMIPDGIYSLRLRAVYAGKPVTYRDYIVHGLLISNSPETPTPEATSRPSPTPTAAPSPTATAVPLPMPALDDGVSSHLYVTLMDQFDPLCPGWRQSYSVWVSNVGMVTITQVVAFDTLPSGCTAQLYRVTKGTVLGDEGGIEWKIDTMGPGEAQKLEFQINVPDWLEQGTWLTNRVVVSADEVAPVSRSETTLLSDCPWLKETAQAKPFVMPTSRPSATALAEDKASPVIGKPTLRLTPTLIEISVTPQDVEKSLDVLTVIISVVLVSLALLTIVMVYRRIVRK